MIKVNGIARVRRQRLKWRRHKWRLHLLGDGRASFLEFLRNLTPTVLLTSAGLYQWVYLDIKRIDLGNWLNTVAFYLCASVALLSMWLNASQYLDNAFAPPKGLGRAKRRLTRRGYKGGRLTKAMLVLLIRLHPLVFLEFVLTVAVIYAAFIAVGRTAFNAAVAALRVAT